jgi:DNA-binding NarL/FixJ family response regulator
MNSTKILIADDHALVRVGIKTLLEQVHGFHIVGEADNGREAIRLVRVLHPDVVILDVSMPGLNGLVALERIRTDFPHVKVIILSASGNEEFVAQALQSGASGYVVKGSPPTVLEVAIKAVMNGETYLCAIISKRVIKDILGRTSKNAELFELLTVRQKEILQLIGEGHSTKEIARILNLSWKTVDNHRTELMHRLDIHDVAGLTRYAITNKIISLEGMP